MKALKALLMIAAIFCFTGQAYATAIYDVTSFLEVQFNYIPNDYLLTVASSSLDSSGTADSNWIAQSSTGLTSMIEATAYGFAGDATGTSSGTASSAVNADYTFHFNFPTDYVFTINYIDSDITIDLDRDFPPYEMGSGGGSIGMYLDGDWIWFNAEHIFSTTLSGDHTLLLTASANGAVSASYPAPVPEPSTFILLGAGLAGVAFMRRRAKK